MAKQSGNILTGTGGPDENEQWPVQNGKIAGNKIAAQVTGPDGAVYTLTLAIDGDHITGDATVTRNGESQKARIELTRVK